MELKIRIRDEEQPARTVTLNRSSISIGRSHECDLRFSSRAVSRHHATIQYTPGAGFLLSDAQSQAGTLLNDQPLTEPTIIRQGDEILLGPCSVIVLEIEEDPTQEKAKPATEDPTWSPSAFVDQPPGGAIVSPASEFPEAAKTQVSPLETSLLQGGSAHTTWKHDYEEALNRLTADFERFWAAVKARTPFSLAGQMQALRDAVESGIEKFAAKTAEVSESHDRLQKLLEASRTISMPLPLRERLETILDLAIEKMNADCGFLMLYSQRRSSLKLALQRGMTGVREDLEFETEITPVIRPGERMALDTLKTGVTMLRSQSSPTDDYSAALTARGIQGAICAPLKFKGKFLGLIYVEFHDPKKLTAPLGQQDADFLDSLASLAALAIENARLIEQRKSLEE